MAADFSLLQTPNFAQAALSGYQAGHSLGQQQRLDAAMQGVDLDKPETLLPLLRADPSTGAALIGASVKLHAENRAQQTQDALSTALSNYLGGSTATGGAATTSPTPPPAPIMAANIPGTSSAPAAPPPPATTDANGDIIVTAHPAVAAMPPSLQQTVGTLVKGGVSLDDAAKFIDIAGKMTKTQADALSDQQDAISSVASAIPKNLSLPDRQAFVAAHKPFLLAHNVPESEIDSFIPTDENISSVQTLALGTKDAMTQAREAAAQAETVKQHGIENGQRQQSIGIEAENAGTSAAHLGIERAQLGLAQQKFKLTSGGGSSGGVSTPTSAAQYNALAPGSRYYKNGQIFVKGGGQ